jgi:hypothetical protein
VLRDGSDAVAPQQEAQRAQMLADAKRTQELAERAMAKLETDGRDR